jgi:poly(3-hydroxybutyrate) depolymerase
MTLADAGTPGCPGDRPDFRLPRRMRRRPWAGYSTRRLRAALRAAAVAALVTAFPAAAAEPPLPALCIDSAAVSVSGVSSGGFMAHQLHIAHSARIIGAGVFAGGPYACAGDGYPGNLFRALNVCSAIAPGPFLGPPDARTSIASVRAAAARAGIDDTAGLRGDRVLLFAGLRDELVPPAVVESVGDVYRAFAGGDGVRFVGNSDAGHAMITVDFGQACAASASPWINDCDFDLAGVTLAHIYGPLAPRAQPQGMLRPFAQATFVDPAVRHGLAERGWVYVPKDCEAGGCRLHVALHGCRQTEAMIGDAFFRHAGYNAWADANRIVVLYPQTAPLRTRFLGIPLPWPNPRACWDWWGFTGPAYAEKHGAQIAAIMAMIDRLTGGGVNDSSAPAPSCASAGGG